MKTRISATFLLFSVVILLNARQSDFSGLTGLCHDQKPYEALCSSGQIKSREPLELNYVANMGVLVSSGDFKVLMDGLFSKPNPVYRAPSPETIKSMIKGEAPFDGIDLVLVTHNHSDHFDPALAVRYLEERPLPILVAPSDAVEVMRKASRDWPEIAQRVIAINLNVGENTKRDVACIPLTIVRTLHGTTKVPMNLMYLIEVNGWGVFHEGDSSGRPDDYLGFGLGTVPVALAHLNIKNESIVEGKIEKIQKFYKDIFVLVSGMPVKVFQK
jgi:L-ascorbate metabolism protein UlaG (beta-lactamase superfamily)